MKENPIKRIEKIYEKNRKFKKKIGNEIISLLNSHNIEKLYFSSESVYNDNDYYTQYTLETINDIPTCLGSSLELDEVDMEAVEKAILKILENKDKVNAANLIKDRETGHEIFQDLELTNEELNLACLSIITSNEVHELREILYLIVNDPEMLPYEVKS